ncbi:MAG: 50S ribosomal protein L13 [Anaerolineae bacterium]|nr:50S ribosomal protein L13 [Anaerolineae bacterium]MCK6577567.1 50S ribosomal protein L13 [Anaerolineae bacterium]NUQ03764.1 50S ribosomal protein L13 [Anaerolineae bacterium]
MKINAHRTYAPTPQDIDRKWWIVDAEGQTLGRLASKIAPILRGKHKPTYAPNMDMGDYVIIINAEKIAVTGKRMDDKMYYRHSGYVGGLSEITLRDQLQKFPNRPIEDAVRGMLPKNALGRQMFLKLKVYAGAEHPHTAQQPTVLEL